MRNITKTREWLASKLNINPDGLKLFIESFPLRYSDRPREIRRFFADSVEYTHNKVGMIIFGPNSIKTNKELINCGYESAEFKNYVKNLK